MTTPLFRKLNLGTHTAIHVVGAPPEFEPALAALQGVQVHRALPGAKAGFVLLFATRQAELDARCREAAAAAEGDAIVWVAYPKASSKRLRCEFNRDRGWAVLGEAGFEPVRQVALDDDWSALRFRRVEHIPTLKRHPDGALTQAGRDRATAARSTPSSSGGGGA